MSFIGKNLIKVFTGQRRVGKSYLMFQIIDTIMHQDPDANIININKEDLSFKSIVDAGTLNAYVLSKKSEIHKNYVYIDEIQEISNFESTLRSLLLYQDIDLYCTGSNAELLSGDIEGKLSGRFIEISVYSLTYNEFLQFQNLEDSQDTLLKY